LLNEERLNAHTVRSGTRKGCLLSLLPFKTILKMLAKTIEQGNEIKGILVGKKVKLYVFADNLTLYIKYSNESTQSY